MYNQSAGRCPPKSQAMSFLEIIKQCPSSFLVDGGDSRKIKIVCDAELLIRWKDYLISDEERCIPSFLHDKGDKFSPLDKLSPSFKSALLVVAGPCAKAQLGLPHSASSRPAIKLAHLPQDPITFFLTPLSDLPSGTQPMGSKCKTGDRIVYDSINGPPFFQSDCLATKPKGVLDFAVSVTARDLVWLDSNLCLASQQYSWTPQYMAELRPRVLDELLYSQNLPGSQKTYKQAGIKYEATSNAPFFAMEAIAGEASSREVKRAINCPAFLRPGCGVLVDVPIRLQAAHSHVERAFGSVVGFETRASVEHVVMQLYLDRDDLPPYVMSRMSAGELIQTNIRATVPLDWIRGTFRISPASLYRATNIIEAFEESRFSDFKDKIVVCDVVIDFMPEHADGSTQNLGILAKVAKSEVDITLRRMDPFPADCALAFLHHQHAVHSGGLHPPAIWYQRHLEDILRSFACQKTAKPLRSTKSIHTMHPRIPGVALMDLLYLKVDATHREVSLKDGNLQVSVADFASLKAVFGIPVDRFNFIAEGYGLVKLHGPFVFRWSMYDCNDQTGPLDGSVSISVGSFTEYDRMGTGVVKSSKCHPDSIKSQGALLKPKRLRDRRADSENQPPDQPPEPSRADLKKQASEAKVKRDALARSNRAMIRLGMEDWTASRLADETQVAEPFHPGPEDCFIVESDRV